MTQPPREHETSSATDDKPSAQSQPNDVLIHESSNVQSASTTPPPDMQSQSQASSVGSGTVHLSDLINDNLIAARYIAFSTIGLLTVYGLAHTPLFFRYRTVAELPSAYFTSRKCIQGRLIRAIPATDADQPIICSIRMLSPAERFLSKSSFDWLMRSHPTASILGKRADQIDRELIRVEVAGIRSPPWYQSASEQPGEWLSRMADERTTVSCQLLARRVPSRVANNATSGSTSGSTSGGKRTMGSVLPELETQSSPQSGSSADQVAVCKLYYRPKSFQFFGTDMAESMVRFGRAVAASDGLYHSEPSEQRVIDTTTNVKDLRKDAAYAERLSSAEYEAAKGSYGMWSDASIRKSRSDVVEEVDFQTTAPFWKKAWRWCRGG